jgi:acyl carrier protein
MIEDDIRRRLKVFITGELIRDPDFALADDQPIITDGLIDSFALAELAVFIEREFGVYIPDPELTVARMNTLRQMVARVLAG